MEIHLSGVFVDHRTKCFDYINKIFSKTTQISRVKSNIQARQEEVKGRDGNRLMHAFFVDQVARTIMNKNNSSEEEINLEVESFESYKQLVEVTNDKIFPLISSAFQAIDDNFVQVVEFYDRYVSQLLEDKETLERENKKIR